jgi:adenylosuccinate lyase
MIPRYARKDMSRIWSPENRYQTWLDIELLACEAMAGLGQIPEEALRTIQQRAGFDLARIEEIEAVTKHDVIAFVSNVAEHVGEDGRYIHLGLTSSDILDTSLAVLLKAASQILLDDMDALLQVLKNQAMAHKNTLMIGRSHGIHAEPVTFGLKMALWFQEMVRNRERLVRAREAISVGKIAGAVGTFSFVDPAVEAHVCRRLGLKPAPVATQIVQRDRHAEFFTTLAIIASSIDKFAQEIRLLQRTEVREAEEYFSPGQKGSSAMPHKRNPVLSENLSGLSRLMRSYALAALEDIPLWHERDISHSSVERVIAPDATILLDFMLARFTGLMERLVVYPERMLAKSPDQGVDSSPRMVLLKLIDEADESAKKDYAVTSEAHGSWTKIGFPRASEAW